MQVHLPGVPVHLHHGDMRAEGVREVGGVVEAVLFQRRLDVVRQVPGQVRLQRYVPEGLRAFRRTADEELAVHEFNVVRVGFQEVSGDAAGLLRDLPRRQRDGRTPDGRRAAAVGAPAHRNLARIAVDDLHVLNRDAEFVRNDLGKSGFLPLTVRVTAGEGAHFGRRMDAHRRTLPQSALEAHRAGDFRGAETANLGIGSEANTEVTTLFAGRRLLLAEAVVVHHLQRHVQGGIVVTAVVGNPRRDGIRELVSADEVLPPDGRRVHLQLRSEHVHEGAPPGTSLPAGRRRGRRPPG